MLVKAYYETLYEMLEANRQLLIKTVEDVLAEELIAGGYEPFDKEKFSAYLEASVAFVDERIELYNPFGMQYLYDRSRADVAFEMEMKLNWYDSSDEFDELLEAARLMLKDMPDQQNLQQAAGELIKEQGAFPAAAGADERDKIASRNFDRGIIESRDRLATMLIRSALVIAFLAGGTILGVSNRTEL